MVFLVTDIFQTVCQIITGQVLCHFYRSAVVRLFESFSRGAVENSYIWIMRNRLRHLVQSEFFRNVATLMTGTSLAQGIALAVYLVLTRIYTPGEHGLFSLYMSIIAITGIIGTGRYQVAVLMPKEDKKAVNLAALAMTIACCVSLLLLVLVVFFRHTVAGWLNNEGIVPWLWFVPLSTLFIALFQVSIYWSNRKKRFRNTAVGNLTQSITASGVKVATFRAIPSGGGLIVGAIAGQALGALYFLNRWFRSYRGSLKDIRPGEMKRTGREYYRFPQFNLPNNLINNFSNSLPVFLLSSFFGASEVGLYSLGFTMIFRPMNLITNSMEQVFAQRIISKYHEGQAIWRDVRLLLTRSVQVGLVPFMLVGLFGPALFRVIFGPEWEEAGRYMQLLIPWFFTAFLANQLTFIPDMFSLQKKAMWINTVRLGLRIAGMAVGIYAGSIMLTLALFSLASLTMVLFTLAWYVRILRRHERMVEGGSKGNAEQVE